MIASQATAGIVPARSVVLPPYHPPATTPARRTLPVLGQRHVLLSASSPSLRSTLRGSAFYTTGMSSDVPTEQQADEQRPAPALPEHLAALVGSLHGPADLGRNHDKYLTYADREEADGAASA